MKQSSQPENLFDQEVLQANRSGRLTRLQRYRLGLRMLLGNGIQMMIGVGACYIGLSVLQSDQNLVLLLLLFVFGATFVDRGLQGWRMGIRRVKGAVTVSKSYIPKTSDRGIARFGTRYYFHVRSHVDDTDILTFRIERDLYETVLPYRQRDSYTVYYLPATKELLSIE